VCLGGKGGKRGGKHKGTRQLNVCHMIVFLSNTYFSVKI